MLYDIRAVRRKGIVDHEYRVIVAAIEEHIFTVARDKIAPHSLILKHWVIRR